MKTVMHRMCLLIMAMAVFCGCSPADTGTSNGTDTHTDDHEGGHNHDDDHGHVHGPHGGEVFALSDTGLKGEWLGKYGDNLVTFYIYGEDGKTEKKIAATSLTASRPVAGGETWEIPAINAEDGMASRFEIVDEKFAIAMKTTGAKLEVEIDGKTHSVQLSKDPHH